MRYVSLSITFLALSLVGLAHAQPASWSPRGIGGGGAFFSPSISPHNPDEVYIPSDMTDLFRTTDLGRSWDVLSFREIRAFPETLVQFTSDPNVRYTLHFDFADDRRVPARSNDGGRTWTPLANDPTAGEAYYLRADEGATNRLVVSDYCRIYFSGDGGATFASIYEDCDFGAPVVGAFWDGNTIVVATIAGLLVSTNGGATFGFQGLNGIASDEGLVSFAGARQGSTTRFVAVTTGRGDFWPGASAVEHWGYRGVYTMDLGTGAGWVRRTSGVGGDDHPFYVGMAKGTVDVAYLAGTRTDLSYPIVLKTSDGGASWEHVFQAVGNRNIVTGWSGYQGDEDWWYDEVSLGFTVASTDPDRAVITGFGFAHATTDGGQTWRQMYVAPGDANPAGAPTPRGRSYRSIGLENTSAWWITWSDPDNLFVSYADIMALRSTDGGASWSKDYDAPDYNSIYHTVRRGNTLYAATASVHDIYQSHRLEDEDLDAGTGAVLYSTDRGATWQMLQDFGHPVVWLARDPTNTDRLYASVVHSTRGGLFVTDNRSSGAGASWRRLAVPPRTEGHPFTAHVLNDGTLVATYSGRRADGFTPSSGVFVSTDGGAAWQDRSDPGMRYWTKDLVVDPHDAAQNTWYAAVFSGWGGPPNDLGGLYRTTDRGASWTRLFAQDRVESATIHPDNPDEMYVTTEYEGLWHTANLTASVPGFSRVESYPFQHPTRVFFDPFDAGNVWIASFGNSLRVGQAGPTGTAVAQAGEVPSGFVLEGNYPNPFNPRTTLRFTLPAPDRVRLTVYDALGRTAAVLVDAPLAAGLHAYVFEAGHLPSGVYLYRLEAGGLTRTRAMLLAK